MKKILATLLVATMLLSCLTFVGFADDKALFTSATYPFNTQITVTETEDEFGDPITAYSFATPLETKWYAAMRAFASAGAYTTTDFDKAMNKAYQGKGEAPELVVTKKQLVAFPIYAFDAGIRTINATFTIDDSLLTPMPANDKTFGTQTINDGKLNLVYANDAAESGFIGNVYFVVNEDAVGDSTGAAVAKIIMNATGNDYRGDAGKYNITYETMSISLTGLTLGADPEPEEPEDVTEDDVAKDAAPIVVPQKGGYAVGDWASETFAAANLQDNVSDEEKAAAEKYSCAFATVDLTNKNYDKVGMALIAEDGSGVRFFEAQKVAANGAYGIVFFGTEKVLGWYKVAPAVMLDGKIIYDETNVSEL